MRGMKETDNEIILLSGLSGSGKSSALRTLEDAGYFAVDNLPGFLFPSLLETLTKARPPHLSKVAVVMDAREKDFLQDFRGYYQILKRHRIRSQIFFFDCRDDVLLRRYSETRRRHPLAPHDRVHLGIQRERKLLYPLRELSTHIIETTDMNVHQLREKMLSYLKKETLKKRMNVTVTSFGYRYGLPLESDLIFDVRFLPNPHFIRALRPLSGKNRRVSEFVLSQPITKKFLKALKAMLRLLILQYAQEGKAYLTLSFGCTGGFHRSVVVSEIVAKRLKLLEYPVKIHHRDLLKGN